MDRTRTKRDVFCGNKTNGRTLQGRKAARFAWRNSVILRILGIIPGETKGINEFSVALRKKREACGD